MLKLWNEIKKEVLNANNNQPQHIINEITKIVFAEVKNEVKQGNVVDKNKINKLIADFWHAHKQEKKSSNRKTLAGYTEDKINIAEELFKISQESKEAEAYINEKLGKFKDFVFKFVGKTLATGSNGKILGWAA